MKKLGLAIGVILFFSLGHLSAQSVNWMSWEDMMKKQKVEKRKIIVDLYTDWCGWCKRMDKTTFRNPVIADYINKKYYAVKFNAEQKEDLEFDGNLFKFVPRGRRGYHEFAAALTQNHLSYPTYVFLTDDVQILQVFAGYQQAKEFEYILNYFGDDIYKTKKWGQFEKDFKPKIK